HWPRAAPLGARAHEQTDAADEQAADLELPEEPSLLLLEVRDTVEIELVPGEPRAEDDVAEAHHQLVDVRSRGGAGDGELLLDDKIRQPPADGTDRRGAAEHELRLARAERRLAGG